MEKKATKKLLQINCSGSGSTGGIMRGIAAQVQQHGYECRMLCAPLKPGESRTEGVIHLGNPVECAVQRKLNKFSGRYGTGFPLASRQLVQELERFSPDIIQLHNLHHQFFDLSALFDYLKKNRIPTVWTLHDCWALTGHCAHYMMNGCERWRTGCGDCPDLQHYPAIYRDTTAQLFAQKTALYANMENLFLVAPSDWTKAQIESSFLRDRPVTVIKNGIDLQAFVPRQSEFRKHFGLEQAFIVLGVSAFWTREKGLDIFLQLAKELPLPFRVVLVGEIDQKTKSLLPQILFIPPTRNAVALAEIYSAADVFFNPTREEVLGLVNVEALACGTPIITFPTGGAPECIDESSGICLSTPTTQAAREVIHRMERGELSFKTENCIQRAHQFDKRKCMAEYQYLYDSILQR